MSQKIESPAELHAEHRHWQSSISMWQFDIQEWKSELTCALEEIERITELIRNHEKTLGLHSDSVEACEASLQFHEKNLAGSLQSGGDPGLDDELVSRHRDEAEKLKRLSDAHERIKKHYHVAIAQVATLKKALESAM